MKKLLGIIIIVALGFGLYYLISNKEENSLAIDKIESYDYVLYSNSSDLYKTYFGELKEILENNYNEEEYAKVESKLFVADFYDLKNKKSNTDIGGLAFVHPDTVNDFKKKARNTIYKFVGSSKKLPEVKEVAVTDIHKVDGTYSVNLDVSYAIDLDYPEKVELKLVLLEKKLYIIEIK